MNNIVNSQVNNAYALYQMTLVEFPEYMIENSGLYPYDINFFNHTQEMRWQAQDSTIERTSRYQSRLGR